MHGHVCYSTGRVVNGVEDWRSSHVGPCYTSFGPLRWISFELRVIGTTASFNANGIQIFKWQTTLPDSGLGGVVIRNSDITQKTFFYNLIVV